MSTKAKYVSGKLTYYDGVTHEHLPIAPVSFYDDFVGKAIDTTHHWTALDTSSAGDTTPVLVANAINGHVTLPIDNTSEAQETGLTFGDALRFGMALKPVFECGLALATLPTTGVVFVWGLATAKNATPDSVTQHAWFRLQATGAVLCESDDTATDNDDKATGITLVAGVQHIFRIDCSNSSDVRFYIDGARVASSTTFTFAGGTPATLALQPYFQGMKASGTGVGVMTLDYVRVTQNRA
jgi:hypothetical protein